MSTRADVLLALGEPRGYGVMRWTTALEPRQVWYYEYVRWQMLPGASSMDPSILLVFFTQDRYDGHLWFSTAKLIEK